MNYSNIFIFIASITLAGMFMGGVIINMNIKNSKDDLLQLEKEIKSLKNDITRQEIEISTLTNPLNIIDFATQNNMKTISIDNIKIINIKK